jgi:hypothetical protein
MDLNYPQWQEPLRAAILEFDAQQVRRKLEVTKQAIAKRIEELQAESRALNAGFLIIRDVRRDRLLSTSGQ